MEPLQGIVLARIGDVRDEGEDWDHNVACYISTLILQSVHRTKVRQDGDLDGHSKQAVVELEGLANAVVGGISLSQSEYLEKLHSIRDRLNGRG